MSRRVKLWIAFVFVVLMAGPVAYLVLSWSPDNPLRFRVLELDTGLPLVRPSAKEHQIAIEVENTTDFPLVLFFGEIGQEDARIMDLGTIMSSEQKDPAVRVSRNGMELAGRERVRVLATVNQKWQTRAREHGAKVKYVWVSESEYWFAMQWRKILDLLPSGIRDFMPRSSEGRDETPLDPFVKGESPLRK